MIDLDRLWVLISAALVFFMQAGFLCFEVGSVRKKNITAVAMKNLIDWTIVSIFFFLVGFGLMFGESIRGWVGGSFFALDGLESDQSLPFTFTFFMFQLAFCVTATTIVSGAMAERTSFVSYLFAAACVGILVYPTFGHWAWGNLLVKSNQPWLSQLGFMDFAGATVVHSVGAWIALVGVWSIGPRLGRYGRNGKINPMKPYNHAWSALGVFILWLGWWGFNAGSLWAFDERVGLIILNTNIIASSAGLSALSFAWLLQKKEDINEKFLGGLLGGLVCSAACCNVVTPLTALAVGLLAGIVHNLAFDLVIKKWKLDDPVGAIPVHGFCGMFGTFCVGLFGRADMLVHPRLIQIGVQLLGIVVCFIWTASIAYIMFKFLKAFVGLRVSPQEEKVGIHIGGEIHTPKPTPVRMDAAKLRKLMGE